VLPAGVRFGAVALPQARAFVAAGPSGVGVSLDTGKTWTAVDTLPAFALFARDREAWIGGTAGWIARVDLDRVLSKEQRPDR